MSQSMFTPAQQAVINTLLQGQPVTDDDIHPMTKKYLLDENVIEQGGDGAYHLTSNFRDTMGTYVQDDDEEPTEEPSVPDTDSGTDEPDIDVQDVPDVVVETSSDISKILMLELGTKLRIQINPQGDTRLLLAGTKHPVIGYNEDISRSGRMKWYHCLFVPTRTPFMVNGYGHALLEMDVTPEIKAVLDENNE